ncbi:ABC-type nitrate/sulfonate/bicarbonate transport system substrate-binding protein [Amorphus suaedae]
MSGTRSSLSVCIFANAGTVPLEIAARRGFFAEEGLSVEIVSTPSSVHQMTGLVEGRYDIAATAVDNVVAYAEGVSPVEGLAPVDLVVFLGSATYRLPFVARPEVGGFAELRGKTIAVDALSTGFAFLLRGMLEDNGLPPGSYDFQSFGAPQQRWEAIRDGKAVAALLNDHFAAIAREHGFHVLESEPDPWVGYQGNAFCARRDRFDGDPETIGAFTRAFLRGVAATLDPANRHEVADALVAHLPGLTAERAAGVAAALQAPGSIISPDMPVSVSGLAKVLDLRSRYGDVCLPTDPRKYLDLRFGTEIA